MAALFAPDGDYQTPQGAVSNGGSAIQSDQAKAYASVMRSARASFDIKRIRFLTPDVSIVDTVFERYGVLDPQGRPVPGRRRALASFILKKENGDWQIASYRNLVPVAFVPGGPTIFDEPGMAPGRALDRKK
ncbi:MAG: SgcJ/EcaC family oxidoreductase [Acidobacteriaceae bacterium]|nr:SgcJ/EcaC family oxidoreductase [Acidobacteriaceae bacterium]